MRTVRARFFSFSVLYRSVPDPEPKVLRTVSPQSRVRGVSLSVCASTAGGVAHRARAGQGPSRHSGPWGCAEVGETTLRRSTHDCAALGRRGPLARGGIHSSLLSRRFVRAPWSSHVRATGSRFQNSCVVMLIREFRIRLI